MHLTVQMKALGVEQDLEQFSGALVQCTQDRHVQLVCFHT